RPPRDQSRATKREPRDRVIAMPPVRLGLRANAAQFALLVVVNAFVGAMVGMERSILPALAEQELHVAARASILSFIVVFAGPKQRGLAMGLNEFAGYFAVGGSALAAGWIAARYGLRPQPFYLGVAFVAIGLGLSASVVRETKHHAAHEATARRGETLTARE